MRIIPSLIVSVLLSWLSFSTYAQIPTHRISGGDSLFVFDFTESKVPYDYFRDNPFVDSTRRMVRAISKGRTASIFSGSKLLYYERNDTFFNDDGIAIFSVAHILDSVISETFNYSISMPDISGYAEDRIYGIYTIRNETHRVTDILVRNTLGGMMYRYTLPDNAVRWMSNAELKLDSISDVHLLTLNATRVDDKEEVWILGSNSEYVYVFKMKANSLELVHTYDALPGGWGHWELYSSVTLNNAGSGLAVGSYSIENPDAVMGKNTRLTTYLFNKKTGEIKFDRLLKEVNIRGHIHSTFYLPRQYDPQDKLKIFQYDNHFFGTHSGSGSVFINLCYSGNDSIVYSSHAGAPFGIEHPQSALDVNFNFPYSNLLAVNINTGEQLTVRYPYDWQNYGLQSFLQANGQIWIHVARGVTEDFWYIVPYPEEIFSKGAIEVEKYSWPFIINNGPPGGGQNQTFGQGMEDYKRLDVGGVDTCSEEPYVRLTVDTSFFEKFRLTQGNVSITLTVQELVKNNFVVKCSSFLRGEHPIILYGLQGERVVQSKTKRLNFSINYVAPLALVEIEDTVGCQWIRYYFSNKSSVFTKDKDVAYSWHLGSELDTTILVSSGSPSSEADVTHAFTKSGDYVISLFVDDGYCKDTFTIDKTIEILEAPRPGIKLSASEGCEPLEVIVDNTYTSTTDSIHYYWGDGLHGVSICTPECGAQKNIYEILSDNIESQEFTIVQQMYGPTGCVTYDTASVMIYASFLPTDTPYLSLVTISTDQATVIYWDSLDHSRLYYIYQNNALIDSTSNLTITLFDTGFANQVYTYAIAGVNVCNDESNRSNKGQNLLLKGERNDNNTESYLTWNEYIEWKNGTSFYRLLFKELTNTFGVLSSELSSSVLSHSDEDFLPLDDLNEADLLAFEKCYRLVAEEKYTGVRSYSNTLCVPYQPILILPNAFSPNNDGLNDKYKVFSLGYISVQLEIYNRWGEKIFQGTSWDGKTDGVYAPSGVYSVLLNGITNTGRHEYKSLTISLIR